MFMNCPTRRIFHVRTNVNRARSRVGKATTDLMNKAP